MEIKEKFKKTEVGVIPKEWNTLAFGDLFTFKGGLSASRDQLSIIGHCYLHYGDIHKSIKTYIDVLDEYSHLPKLDIAIQRVSNNALLTDGDVVFVDASEDDEGASKHIVIRNKSNKPFISGLHTIVSKSKTSLLDNRFKEFCFQSECVKRQFKFYSAGTKVCGVSKGNIVKMLLPIPPLPEQQAISTVLLDIDGLINLLAKLIEKKKNIKKGAMQELLTGSKRLDGFSCDWLEKTIGELLNYEQPWKYATSQLLPYNSSLIPVLTANKAFILGSTSETNNFYTNLPAIIFDDFTTDLKYVNFKFKVRSSAIKILTAKADVSLEFVSNLMQITPFILIDHKRYYISEYQNITVKVPSYAEQTAIAEVISNMDNEIQVLERKLNKYKVVKQGMMQELLTGRIRLVGEVM